MKERGLLKSQFIKAWKQCIDEDYCTQRINSESGLLVFFCSHLHSLLPKTRRMFVEPEIKITINRKTKIIIPDLIICNTKEVIGIIEFKYMPRARPEFRKDIKSLAMLAQSREGIKISNERFLGKPMDDRKYTFSKNILFVWAGIHKFNSEIPIDNLLRGCFLELHAQAINDDNPKKYWRNQ